MGTPAGFFFPGLPVHIDGHVEFGPACISLPPELGWIPPPSIHIWVVPISDINITPAALWLGWARCAQYWCPFLHRVSLDFSTFFSFLVGVFGLSVFNVTVNLMWLRVPNTSFSYLFSVCPPALHSLLYWVFSWGSASPLWVWLYSFAVLIVLDITLGFWCLSLVFIILCPQVAA